MEKQQKSVKIDVEKAKNYQAARNGSSRHRSRKRIVTKSGYCNIGHRGLNQRNVKYFKDIFTTLLDLKWRWVLLIFAMSFFLSWLGFGLLFYLIAVVHGDLEELHLPEHQAENGWKPCVSNIESFVSCFMFSMESQHTIGYGVRATTEECPEAIFMMCMQGICGVMIQAFMGGIVFAKLTRSKARSQTLLFSKNAVINRKDGDLCLMFRVGDMRKSRIIGATIRAQLIRSSFDKNSNVIRQYQTELDLTVDDCGSDLLFIWPINVVHRINFNSPLYDLSFMDLVENSFEIVVILEGTIESTGQSVQARSSFLNSEILWGSEFEPLIYYCKKSKSYEVDYSKFNATNPVETPLESAKELDEKEENHAVHFKIQTEKGVQVDQKPKILDVSLGSENEDLFDSSCFFEKDFRDKQVLTRSHYLFTKAMKYYSDTNCARSYPHIERYDKE